MKISYFDKVAVSGFDGELKELLDERSHQWKDTYKVIGKFSEEVLGIPMTPEQFCSFMTLLKITRYSRAGYNEDDCLRDIIGYANLILHETEK